MTAPLYNDEPPAADRLRAMIGVLASGADLEESLRAEIIDALKRHEAKHENRRITRSGRRIEDWTWNAAAIADELLRTKRAGALDDAVRAAIESVKHYTEIEPKFATVKKNYHKMHYRSDGWVETKNGDLFKPGYILSPELIEYAQARLRGSED